MQHLVGDIFLEGVKAQLLDRTDEFGVGVKRLVIEGIGIVCDIPGINNRSYPRRIIEREMKRPCPYRGPRTRFPPGYPRCDPRNELPPDRRSLY